MKRVLVAVLKMYRMLISPLYGQTCRYYPSCSAYALRAVEVHGASRGSWLALRRLVRCHPWTPGGVDLVPPPVAYRWWGRDLQYTDPPSDSDAAATTCHVHHVGEDSAHSTLSVPGA